MVGLRSQQNAPNFRDEGKVDSLEPEFEEQVED